MEPKADYIGLPNRGCEFDSHYPLHDGLIAQWQSNRLLTDRLKVRVLLNPQYESAAQMVDGHWSVKPTHKKLSKFESYHSHLTLNKDSIWKVTRAISIANNASKL